MITNYGYEMNEVRNVTHLLLNHWLEDGMLFKKSEYILNFITDGVVGIYYWGIPT